MSTSVRPRRSVLYMSGANARALEKARSLPVDGVILDLEDAVLPSAKSLARQQIKAALTEDGYGSREKILRINTLDSPWLKEDLALLASVEVDAVLLPKLNSGRMLEDYVKALDEAGVSVRLPVWVMIETPMAVLKVEEIIAASNRLECLVAGTSDLTKDLRARHVPSREPLLTALGRCVLAARAYGLSVLDGVHLSIKDFSGLRAACEQGRSMGFDGKTLIHPNQIDTANALFSPSPEEIEEAKSMISAWSEAEQKGQGVCVVNGRLIEKLHVEEAVRIVELAEAIDALAGDNVDS